MMKRAAKRRPPMRGAEVIMSHLSGGLEPVPHPVQHLHPTSTFLSTEGLVLGFFEYIRFTIA